MNEFCTHINRYNSLDQFADFSPEMFDYREDAMYFDSALFNVRDVYLLTKGMSMIKNKIWIIIWEYSEILEDSYKLNSCYFL